MLRRRSVAFIPVAVGALLGGLGVFSVSAAPPTGTDASEVSHWNQVAANTLIAFPGPDGGAPPAFQINMGMVQGAVYDAVNAIGHEAASAVSAREACGCQGVDRRCRRNGGVRRARRPRLDVTRRASVPGSRGTPGDAHHASTTHRSMRSTITPSRGRASRSGTRRPRPCSTRGSATDGSAPSQWDAEHRPRTVAAAHQSDDWAPILDPTPWVGDREAVPHPELVAVPAACHRPRLSSAQWATEFNEVKASAEPPASTRTDRADVHRQVVAERTRS